MQGLQHQKCIVTGGAGFMGSTLTRVLLNSGADVAIRKALAVTTTGRNAAVGLAIVTSNFAGTPAVTAVVAYALVSILGTFVCAALLGMLPGPSGEKPDNFVTATQN